MQSSNLAGQSGGDWIAGDWIPLLARGWQHQQVPQPEQDVHEDVEDEEGGEHCIDKGNLLLKPQDVDEAASGFTVYDDFGNF